jgi:hypothetical protein
MGNPRFEANVKNAEPRCSESVKDKMDTEVFVAHLASSFWSKALGLDWRAVLISSSLRVAF